MKNFIINLLSAIFIAAVVLTLIYNLFKLFNEFSLLQALSTFSLFVLMVCIPDYTEQLKNKLKNK